MRKATYDELVGLIQTSLIQTKPSLNTRLIPQLQP
jgi:hypothetical protein